MQEYWVNVYPNNVLGSPLETRQLCIDYNPSKEYIYRIHVKMKPVVPKYEYLNFIEGKSGY